MISIDRHHKMTWSLIVDLDIGIYSAPFEVVHLLEELFSHPWLSLQSPRFHRSLHLVSRCPHKFFSDPRQKSGHLRATIPRSSLAGSDLWKRGDCIDNQGWENSSSNKCTTSKEALYQIKMTHFLWKKIGRFCDMNMTSVGSRWCIFLWYLWGAVAWKEIVYGLAKCIDIIPPHKRNSHQVIIFQQDLV